MLSSNQCQEILWPTLVRGFDVAKLTPKISIHREKLNQCIYIYVRSGMIESREARLIRREREVETRVLKSSMKRACSWRLYKSMALQWSDQRRENQAYIHRFHPPNLAASSWRNSGVLHVALGRRKAKNEEAQRNERNGAILGKSLKVNK